MRDLRDLIERRTPGLLTYGLTPPKRATPDERRREIASIQAERVRALPIDGLVLYDIQDESARTPSERPFPFVQSIDPVDYAYDDLSALGIPKIVYQCVSPRTSVGLTQHLGRIEGHGDLSVLVGAASRTQETLLRLPEAYALRREHVPTLPLGGVLIPERHALSQQEDARALKKLDAGCSFFVTQGVYAVESSKDVLSDLYYRCQEQGRPMPTVLVTLSPCGSLKTLDFMRWLGISVPRWLHNELTHAHDILETSLDVCATILADLVAFAADKRIPLGCNVESVSTRKVEIEASVELVHRARAILSAAS